MQPTASTSTYVHKKAEDIGSCFEAKWETCSYPEKWGCPRYSCSMKLSQTSSTLEKHLKVPFFQGQMHSPYRSGTDEHSTSMFLSLRSLQRSRDCPIKGLSPFLPPKVWGAFPCRTQVSKHISGKLWLPTQIPLHKLLSLSLPGLVLGFSRDMWLAFFFRMVWAYITSRVDPVQLLSSFWLKKMVWAHPLLELSLISLPLELPSTLRLPISFSQL